MTVGTKSDARTASSNDWLRMHQRIEELGAIGASATGGRTRLAGTDADRQGRDLLVSWMKADGLEVCIDQVGNIFGCLAGSEPAAAPIMIGSHIDTPNNAGMFDGCYGVLAGLEVASTVRQLNPPRGLVIAAFSNEEGVRFQPDMMGSLVYSGEMSTAEALDARAFDGPSLGSELDRIGYLGEMRPGSIRPAAFLELHIEQGPVLEAENLQIGAVESLQAILWREVVIQGTANHAGTTPMGLRRDAGLAAAELTVFLRRLVTDLVPGAVGTVGRLNIAPNAINVVPCLAELVVDLRHPVDATLTRCEALLSEFIDCLTSARGVRIETKDLTRSSSVRFDNRLVDAIMGSALRRGYTARRMASGAGHDAQMMAKICPSAMIFVPSKDGISHNPREWTAPEELNRGADILHDVAAALVSTTNDSFDDLQGLSAL